MGFHKLVSALEAAANSFSQLESVSNEDLQAQPELYAQLRSVIAKVHARFEQLGIGDSSSQKDTDMVTRSFQKKHPKEIASVLLPIVHVRLGKDPPLVVENDWNPEWRSDVDDVTCGMNKRLHDGEFSFVDDVGNIHRITDLSDLNEMAIRAVIETIARKLKDLAFPTVERTAILHRLLEDARHDVR